MGDYRLWVNDDRTTLFRLWDSGEAEVANRETAGHTWSPPLYLSEESVIKASERIAPDCAFCKPETFGGIEGAEWRSDTECWVIPSRSPQAETHLLVVPRQHVPTFADADPRTISAVMETAQKVAQERGLDGYRVVVNVGETGKQKVFHLHVHVLAGPEVLAPGFTRNIG